MMGTRLSRSASAPALHATAGSYRHSASAPTLKPTVAASPQQLAQLSTLKSSASLASLSKVNPYSSLGVPPVETRPKHVRLYQQKKRRSVVGASNRPHVSGLEELYSLTSHVAKTPVAKENEDIWLRATEPMFRNKTTVIDLKPPPARPQSPYATLQQTALFADAPIPMPTPFAKVDHERFARRELTGEKKPSLQSVASVERGGLVKVTGEEVRLNYFASHDGRECNYKPPGARGKPAHQAGPQGPEQQARDAAAEGAAVERIMGHLRKHLSGTPTIALRRVLKPIFRAMDEDLSGSLDYDQFARAMRRLGVDEPRPHLDAVARTIDLGGDGVVSYDTFVDAVISPSELQDLQNLQRGLDRASVSTHASTLNSSVPSHAAHASSVSTQARAEKQTRGRDRAAKGQQAKLANRLHSHRASIGSFSTLFGRTPSKGNYISREDIIAAFQSRRIVDSSSQQRVQPTHHPRGPPACSSYPLAPRGEPPAARMPEKRQRRRSGACSGSPIPLRLPVQVVRPAQRWRGQRFPRQLRRGPRGRGADPLRQLRDEAARVRKRRGGGAA